MAQRYELQVAMIGGDEADMRRAHAEIVESLSNVVKRHLMAGMSWEARNVSDEPTSMFTDTAYVGEKIPLRSDDG
jgi:hypothetical protein